MSGIRIFRRLRDHLDMVFGTPSDGDVLTYDSGTDTFVLAAPSGGGGGGGAPTTADYLVGTANGSLSAEIVVGTSPGGELGGTWASPTVDATHSGSSHAQVQAAAEATAAAALAAQLAATVVAASGSSETLTLPSAAHAAYDITLTADCTISITGGGGSGMLQVISLALRQDGSGGHSVIWPTITWAGGVSPSLASGPSQVTLVRLYTFDGGTSWLGEATVPDTDASDAVVTTSLATSSSSYTDLSDGPNAAITVEVGASGVLLVGWSCSISGTAGYASVALTGATAAAASDTWALSGIAGQVGRTHMFSGLTPGTTTVTMKYRSSSGSITFANREVWAVAL